MKFILFGFSAVAIFAGIIVAVPGVHKITASILFPLCVVLLLAWKDKPPGDVQ